MSDVVRIGMLGGGTVGQGVARIIRDTADTIERATGHRLESGQAQGHVLHGHTGGQRASRCGHGVAQVVHPRHGQLDCPLPLQGGAAQDRLPTQG